MFFSRISRFLYEQDHLAIVLSVKLLPWLCLIFPISSVSPWLLGLTDWCWCCREWCFVPQLCPVSSHDCHYNHPPCSCCCWPGPSWCRTPRPRSECGGRSSGWWRTGPCCCPPWSPSCSAWTCPRWSPPAGRVSCRGPRPPPACRSPRAPPSHWGGRCTPDKLRQSQSALNLNNSLLS